MRTEIHPLSLDIVAISERRVSVWWRWEPVCGEWRSDMEKTRPSQVPIS